MKGLLLAFLLCLSGRCIGQIYDGFYYSVSGTNITITVGVYTGAGGEVTIPSSIPGVGAVTAIGDRAFYGWTNLTSVAIPSTVRYIGDGAFYGCSGLSSVTIPSSVTYIGDDAFYGCSGLTGVAIPSGVANIGSRAFLSCAGLTGFAVDAQNGFYSSVGGVLLNKSQTTLLQCPERIAGAYTIPGSVTYIGGDAFSGCGGLTSVAIPSGVANIGSGAFLSCSSLTGFTVDAQNPFYSSLGGVLFDKNQTALIEWPPGRAGAYVIPSSVTIVGEDAFSACSGLTSLTVPSSVTYMGQYAFASCSGLTNVTIGNGVPSIGAMAFYGCRGLTGLTIPGSVTSIGEDAFSGCGGLTSLAIPSGVAYMGQYAFASCSGLTNVTIGNGVPSIALGAFSGCSGLATVMVPGGVTNIGSWAFDGCSGLTRAYFQGSAPSTFGSGVFGNTSPGFSIYYPLTASGWSTPTWMGYPAQPYDYAPAAQRPLLSLILGWGAVAPSFRGLVLGAHYQLQVSTDLNTWSNMGPVFTATNTSEVYFQPFGVKDWNRLFFRLWSSP